MDRVVSERLDNDSLRRMWKATVVALWRVASMRTEEDEEGNSPQRAQSWQSEEGEWSRRRESSSEMGRIGAYPL